MSRLISKSATIYGKPYKRPHVCSPRRVFFLCERHAVKTCAHVEFTTFQRRMVFGSRCRKVWTSRLSLHNSSGTIVATQAGNGVDHHFIEAGSSPGWVYLLVICVDGLSKEKVKLSKINNLPVRSRTLRRPKPNNPKCLFIS